MTWNFKTLASTAFLISLVGCVWLVYSSGRRSGMTEVQASWDKQQIALQQAIAQEQTRARQRESALQELVARLKKEHQDEARRVAAEYQRVIDELRNRPEVRAGASGVPDNPSAGVGCTGKGLARPDATFLAGYAADAARLQSALDACQAAYNSVKQSVPVMSLSSPVVGGVDDGGDR